MVEGPRERRKRPYNNPKSDPKTRPRGDQVLSGSQWGCWGGVDSPRKGPNLYPHPPKTPQTKRKKHKPSKMTLQYALG
eukprot:908765-Amphidinium_carterae.1